MRVVTDDETYDAAVVVVAAGAWAADLLSPHLTLPPLVVTQETAFHFAPRDPHPWPSFIHYDRIACYGLETPGEGVKVAEHHTGPVVTASGRDFVVDATARERVATFVEGWLPGLVPEPVSEVTCLYTNTATEDFVLDRVGPVVVASMLGTRVQVRAAHRTHGRRSGRRRRHPRVPLRARTFHELLGACTQSYASACSVSRRAITRRHNVSSAPSKIESTRASTK